MTSPSLQQHGRAAMWALFVVTFVFFLENFDRYLLTVALIPYLDYSSYEYSLLSGTLFAVFYAIGGIVIALFLVQYDSLKRSVGGASPEAMALDEERTVVSYMRYLVVSTGIFSLIFACTALATNFAQQALIRMATGLLQSIITPISMSIIHFYFDSDESENDDTMGSSSADVVGRRCRSPAAGAGTSVMMKGTALGTFNYGVYLAFSLSLSLGTWVLDRYGWKANYVLFGLVGFGFSVIAPFLVNIRKVKAPPVAATAIITQPINSSSRSIGTGVGTATDAGTVAVGPMPVSVSVSVSPGVDYSSVGPGMEVGRLLQNPVAGPHADDCSSINTHADSSSGSSSSSSSGWRAQGRGRTLSASGRASYGWRMYLSNSRYILQCILSHWYNKFPVTSLLLILAAGLRSGAGYVWVTYMAIYYSEEFTPSSSADSSSCQYSYNAEYSGSQGLSSCDSTYPYCMDGECNALFPTPWHNRGISHVTLEQYMWWVPLVGSAMGCLCGGMLSDYFIAKGVGGNDNISTKSTGCWWGMGQYCPSARRGLLGDGSDKTETSDSNADNGGDGLSICSWRGFLGALRTVLCGGTGGRALVAGVGVVLAMPFVYLALVNSVTAPVPVCFFMLILSGFLGEAYIGLILTILLEITPKEGYFAELPVTPTSALPPSTRTQQTSAAASRIPSRAGQMQGQTQQQDQIQEDHEEQRLFPPSPSSSPSLSPSPSPSPVVRASPAPAPAPAPVSNVEHIKVPLLVPTVALFGLFVNTIAGNTPLLVPLVMDTLTRVGHYSHVFDFMAAPMISPDSTGTGADSVEVPFAVEATGAQPLQSALLFTLLSLYAVSGVLFIVLAVVLSNYKVGVYPNSSSDPRQEQEQEQLQLQQA